MRCCGLTMGEVHKVAYLTMKGWMLIGEQWTKEGFVRTYDERRACGCGGCVDEKKSDYFDLDDAYDAQTEKDDGSA